MGIELNNDQILAGYKFERWWKHQDKQVFEIEGGAGTGKTTMILYLLEKYNIELDEVLFVSYMGKAVSQMIRNGLPAKTIHATCYRYEHILERDEDGKVIMIHGKPKKKIIPILKDELDEDVKLIVVDEGYTIPENNALDLLSFNIPIVVLGDSHQLPPPFGKPYFLESPDVTLHQIMRQAEGNPIIYLAQRALNHMPLLIGVYGNSAVIPRNQLSDFTLQNSDVIITSTNRLRGEINDLFRTTFRQYPDLDIPHYNEKIICRRNDWSRFIKMGSEIYLTNGLTGFVDYIDKRTYNKKNVTIDFRPDFANKCFRNLKISLSHLNGPLGGSRDEGYIIDSAIFEYAYALTAYSAQGSQWHNTCILQERNMYSMSDKGWKELYSAITRAVNSTTIAI